MVFDNVSSYFEHNTLCVDLLKNSQYATSRVVQILLQIKAIQNMDMTDGAKTKILDELTIELYCEKLNTELRKIDDEPYPIDYYKRPGEKPETIYPSYYMKEQVDEILDLHSPQVEKLEGIDRFFALNSNRSLKKSSLSDDRFALPGESKLRYFYLLEDYALGLMRMENNKLQGKALFRWVMSKQ